MIRPFRQPPRSSGRAERRFARRAARNVNGYLYAIFDRIGCRNRYRFEGCFFSVVIAFVRTIMVNGPASALPDDVIIFLGHSLSPSATLQAGGAQDRRP